jgi:type IV pilus assembly protein PilX
MKTAMATKQKGVTLVFSLVILVTLTILGISTIQSTRTELAMVGNQRESILMFQAAEMGLKAAENYIANSTSNGDFNDSSLGLSTVDAQSTLFELDYFDATTWAINASQEAGADVFSSAKPRYIIEYMGDRKQDPLASSVNIGNYGSGQTGSTVSIYRATARGVGLTGNSFRYIQSYFGKIAP